MSECTFCDDKNKFDYFKVCEKCHIEQTNIFKKRVENCVEKNKEKIEEGRKKRDIIDSYVMEHLKQHPEDTTKCIADLKFLFKYIHANYYNNTKEKKVEKCIEINKEKIEEVIDKRDIIGSYVIKHLEQHPEDTTTCMADLMFLINYIH
jgi:hypothetical protein